MGSTEHRRAVEVTNYGTETAALENYSLRIFLDGSTATSGYPDVRIPLSRACSLRLRSGSCRLLPGHSLTVLDESFDLARPEGLTVEDDLLYDGVGDAIGLFQRERLVDSLGTRFDADNAWGAGITLRRDPDDLFGNVDWISGNGANDFSRFPVDDVSGLGEAEKGVVAGGIPWWVWLIVALIVLLLILLLCFCRRRRKQKAYSTFSSTSALSETSFSYYASSDFTSSSSSSSSEWYVQTTETTVADPKYEVQAQKYIIAKQEPTKPVEVYSVPVEDEPAEAVVKPAAVVVKPAEVATEVVVPVLVPPVSTAVPVVREHPDIQAPKYEVQAPKYEVQTPRYESRYEHVRYDRAGSTYSWSSRDSSGDDAIPEQSVRRYVDKLGWQRW